jgi:hypothetical protein
MEERGLVFEATGAHSVALKGKPQWVVAMGKVRGEEVQLSLELRRNEGKKGKGDRNAAGLRGNVYRQELLERFRRKPLPHPITKFVAGCFGGRSEAIDGFFVCFQTTETNGYLTLDLVLAKEFSTEWLRLTDRFRCLQLSMFVATEKLHVEGWRFGHVFPWMLACNLEMTCVKLVHPGFGVMCKPDEELCNKGSTKKQGTNVLQRKTTSFYAAAGGPAPPSVDCKRFDDLLDDDERVGLRAVNFREPELKNLWKELVGKETGMIVPEGGLFIDEGLRPISENANDDSFQAHDPEVLRVSDIHQILLIIVKQVVGSRDSNWMEKLSCVLQDADARQRRVAGGRVGEDVDEVLVDGLARVLDPDGTAEQQPLARHRLARFLASGLGSYTRWDVVSNMSSKRWVSLPVLTPDQEALVCPGGLGIRMFAKLNALPGDLEFEGKIRDKLKKIRGLEELWKNPRQVLLKDEPGKGLGVFGEGVWEKGTFAMFYMARNVEDPSGRYIVSKEIGGHGPYADGAPCIELPMETFIERGTPGSFVNGAMGAPNLAVERDMAFMHKDLWWIPMTVIHTFTDAFTGWKYKYNAERGCNMSD